MDTIKKDTIDIQKNEENTYYFKRDIIIIIPNDTLYSADAYILDVINAHIDDISEEDKLMLDSLLFEAFDNKAICPEISIMKDADGMLKLRNEDPYRDNLTRLELVSILVKTKKEHIVTRKAWEYLIKRYPNATVGVLPSIMNINMSTYYESDNNYFLVDTLNMPFDELKLIEFINPLMISKIITYENGERIFSKLAFETTTDLQNKVFITLVTSEFGNIDLIPLLFNVWFENEKTLNLILEHIDYSLTIIQDSIINKIHENELTTMLTLIPREEQEVLPFTLVDLWNPHLQEELEIQNKLMEIQKKIQKKDKYI